MEPKTDRELFIQLSGQMDSLNKSIESLGEAIRNLEEKRLAKIEKELEEMRLWKTRLEGGWKLAVVLWAAGSGAIIVAVKQFFK